MVTGVLLGELKVQTPLEVAVPELDTDVPVIWEMDSVLVET